MKCKEHRAAESKAAREDYEAPEITVLGKVEDLTHGEVGPLNDATLVGSA
jgi:hypothetical protein